MSSLSYSCRDKTITWVKSLRVGLDYRDYTVQLHRQIGFCSEAYRLYVNDQEIEDHKLTRNPCSPLCGSGGQFEFEQDGHVFLLMFDCYAWQRRGQFRLFIDGINVSTGLEYSAYWRRRGWQTIGTGALILLLAAVLYVILALLVKVTKVRYIAYTAGVAFVAVTRFIGGLIMILKNQRSRYIALADDEALLVV